MWRGLYTAATGMATEMKRTDVIANNLANAATTGYKKDLAIHREFENLLIKRVYDHDNDGMVGMDMKVFNRLGNLNTSAEDITQFKGFKVDAQERPTIGKLGLGDYIDEIAVDYSQGALQSTGNAFDLAIGGNGFFAVQTPDGVRYTRNGAFFKNSTGLLQDISGNNLLDVTGNPITIPANTADDKISINGAGEIMVHENGIPRQIARIQVVQFADRHAIQKQGDSLFYAVTDNQGNVAQPQPATGEVLQGMLEKSNTEIVQEMVELIHNHRLYEANSKAVTTQDTMLDAAVNQLGRIGS